MAVRIVTDSSADLPRDLAAELGVTVVPLTVRFGAEAFVDGLELAPRDFWARCARSPVLPVTAAPESRRFAACYEGLAAGDADAILSLHLSSRLSGTVQAAHDAAREVSADVRVVDTDSVSAGQGILVREAARLCAAGLGIDEVEAAVEAMKPRIRIHACLDTLENLRKGGRIGGARAFVGSMLNVKPLITLHHGEVEAAGQVRTRARALASLVERATADMPLEHLSVFHGNARDLEGFLELVEDLGSAPFVTEVGAVVGAHSGPGVIGLAYLRGTAYAPD